MSDGILNAEPLNEAAIAKYEQLRKNIEAIDGPVSETEDQYKKIFHELTRETNRQERKLLGDKSFFLSIQEKTWAKICLVNWFVCRKII